MVRKLVLLSAVIVAGGYLLLHGRDWRLDHDDLAKANKADPCRADIVELDAVRHRRIETRLNTHTASTQAGASLAVTAAGDAMVVWDSRRQQNFSDGVYGQRVSSDGRRLGEVLQLNRIVRAQQRSPAIALGHHGEMLAAWHSIEGADETCLVRRIDRDLESTRLAKNAALQSAVSLATHGNGFVAAWLQTDENQRVPTPQFALLDQSGRTIAGPLRAGDGSASTVAIASSGSRIFIVWAAPTARATSNIVARAFGVDGKPSGPMFHVDGDAEPGAQHIEPRLAMDGDGNLAVTWLRQRHATPTKGYDVMLARFDQRGRALGGPIVVKTGNDAWLSGAAVALTRQGLACVAYNHEAEQSRICGRWIDTANNMSREFTLTRPQRGKQQLLVADGRTPLAFDASNRLFVAWSGDGDLGDQSGVHLTILTPMASHATSQDSAPVPHDPPVYVAAPANASPPPPSALMAIGPDFGFAGLSRTGGLTPPDPHLAAGTQSLMMVTNDNVGIFGKDGKPIYSVALGRTNGFWTPAGGNASSFVFDPEVHWDNFANRFVVFANERNGSSSFFNLAVSKDANPSAATSFYYYRFNVSSSIGTGIDSPNLGLDKDAYYMAADFYGGASKHGMLIVDKASILAGKTPTVQNAIIFSGGLAFGLPVMWGAGPAMYLIQDFAGSTTVRLHAITGALSSAPKVVTTDVTVPSYSAPASITSQGTSVRQTTFGTRFWSCVWRNGSLWACHHTGSPTVQARWYEIATGTWPSSGTPTLVQSGTVPMSSGVHASFNAITPDADGNALTVYAVSSPNHYLSIGRSWRLKGDPKGSMRASQIVQANTAAYGVSRWGDYSGAAADPAEPNTIWYVHEYAPSNNVWGTWIGKTVLQPLGADRTSITQAGGTVTFTLDNPSHAGKQYFMVATCSGTKPGFQLGGLTVPINWDACSDVALSWVNSPVLSNFFGKLDANGMATARAVAPANLGLVGIKMYFAYAQDGNTWSFVSNPVEIAITK